MDEPTAKRCPTHLQGEKSCKWCRDSLPKHSRLDAKYCCGRCRHYAAVGRGHSGKVYRVQALKNGKVSIVIHADKTGLTPGDMVGWIKD